MIYETYPSMRSRLAPLHIRRRRNFIESEPPRYIYEHHCYYERNGVRISASAGGVSEYMEDEYERIDGFDWTGFRQELRERAQAHHEHLQMQRDEEARHADTLKEVAQKAAISQKRK